MHIPIVLPSIRGTGLVAVEALLVRAWIAFAIRSMQGGCLGVILEETQPESNDDAWEERRCT